MTRRIQDATSWTLLYIAVAYLMLLSMTLSVILYFVIYPVIMLCNLGYGLGRNAGRSILGRPRVPVVIIRHPLFTDEDD